MFPRLYNAFRYFAARYFSSVSEEVPVQPVTGRHVSYVVPAEDRTHIVPAQNRVYVVPPQNRIHRVTK